MWCLPTSISKRQIQNQSLALPPRQRQPQTLRVTLASASLLHHRLSTQPSTDSKSESHRFSLSHSVSSEAPLMVPSSTMKSQPQTLSQSRSLICSRLPSQSKRKSKAFIATSSPIQEVLAAQGFLYFPQIVMTCLLPP